MTEVLAFFLLLYNLNISIYCCFMNVFIVQLVSFYVRSPFNIYTVLANHKLLYIVPFLKVYLFAIPPVPFQSSIYKSSSGMCPSVFPVTFAFTFDCLILQAPFLIMLNFYLSFPDSEYNCHSCFHYLYFFVGYLLRPYFSELPSMKPHFF